METSDMYLFETKSHYSLNLHFESAGLSGASSHVAQHCMSRRTRSNQPTHQSGNQLCWQLLHNQLYSYYMMRLPAEFQHMVCHWNPLGVKFLASESSHHCSGSSRNPM